MHIILKYIFHNLQLIVRAITHCENAYNIPNVKASGRLCRTNISTNTAFRGFGGPQTYFIAETWMGHVADFLGRPHKEVRHSVYSLITLSTV